MRGWAETPGLTLEMVAKGNSLGLPREKNLVSEPGCGYSGTARLISALQVQLGETEIQIAWCGGEGRVVICSR